MLLGLHVKECEMNWSCSTYERLEMQTQVWMGDVKRRDHVRGPYVTESIVLNGSERNTERGRGLNETDWDREEWWTVVNAVLNLPVPWNARNLFLKWGTASFSWRVLYHVRGLNERTVFCFNACSLNSRIIKSNTTVSYMKDLLHMSGVHFDAMVYRHKEI
jgi:hypothetical protein